MRLNQAPFSHYYPTALPCHSPFMSLSPSAAHRRRRRRRFANPRCSSLSQRHSRTHRSRATVPLAHHHRSRIRVDRHRLQASHRQWSPLASLLAVVRVQSGDVRRAPPWKVSKMQTYYVVFVGRKHGVTDSWAECQKMILLYHGSLYKTYKSKEAVVRAWVLYEPRWR